MPLARTYEEPDARDDHALYTHPDTSLRVIDPFTIVYSEKASEWCYPTTHLVGPYRMRDLRDDLVRMGRRLIPGYLASSFNSQMEGLAAELDVMRLLATLGDVGVKQFLAALVTK